MTAGSRTRWQRTTGSTRPPIPSRAVLGAVVTAVLAGALAVGPVGVASAAAPSAGAAQPSFRLGARPYPVFLSAGSYGPRLATATRAALDAGSLPDSVDLSGDAPAPGNQGAVGSCVSWSIGYSIAGWHARATGHAGAPYAPMFLYSQVNGGRDAGSTTSANYSVIEGQGIAEQRLYPNGQLNWRTRPTAAQKANARENKSAAHSYLFSGPQHSPAAQTAIRSALANGTPVTLVIPVYGSFYSLGSGTMSSSMATGPLAGYHAVAAFGYDSGGVRFMNSWGGSWGDAGWGRLGWDFVRDRVVEASVLTGFAPDTEVPTVASLSSRNAPSSGGSTITVTGTHLASIDGTAHGAVRLVGVSNPALALPATLTARTSTSLQVSLPSAPGGSYRLVLTNGAGSSLDSKADDLRVIAPVDAVVAPGSTALARGGTRLTLTGSGFGATRSAFNALGITATVNGARATLAWLNDGALAVTVPRGPVGGTAQVRLWRAGLGGAVSTAVSYV